VRKPLIAIAGDVGRSSAFPNGSRKIRIGDLTLREPLTLKLTPLRPNPSLPTFGEFRRNLRN
jgi:hypothetical protein